MIRTPTAPVLFFDGECNLCNGLVQFILKWDKKKTFLFASLQSETGREAIAHVTIPGMVAPDSVVLLYKETWYVRSSAALHIFKLLGWPWSLLFAGIIIPRFLRDGLYNFIAHNRYKWFGKRDKCMVPDPGIMDRFLSK